MLATHEEGISDSIQKVLGYIHLLPKFKGMAQRSQERHNARMTGKDESRHLRAEIRRVLMNDWDPIGVKDVPEAADEYDMYLSDVCGLIVQGASSSKIAEYLRWVEVERMGLIDAHGNPLLADGLRGSVAASLVMLKSKPSAT